MDFAHLENPYFGIFSPRAHEPAEIANLAAKPTGPPIAPNPNFNSAAEPFSEATAITFLAASFQRFSLSRLPIATASSGDNGSSIASTVRRDVLINSRRPARLIQLIAQIRVHEHVAPLGHGEILTALIDLLEVSFYVA